jgi:transcriptional regulator with XRE-family HTH domain
MMTRLKAERLRRRWSQLALARRARVANSDLSKWERRISVPYPAQARRLSKALNVPVEGLLEDIGDQPAA